MSPHIWMTSFTGKKIVDQNGHKKITEQNLHELKFSVRRLWSPHTNVPNHKA